MLSPEVGFFYFIPGKRMTKVTTIILLRHGVTKLNIRNCFQGKTDEPLNSLGKKQAQLMANRLKQVNFDVIFTSPAKRAYETSQIIFAKRKIPLYKHDGLTEINFGLWEGLTYKQIKAKYPIEVTKWEEDALNFAPPQGETLKDIFSRLSSFIERIKVSYQGKTICIVGHGGSFNIFFCTLFGIKPKSAWQFEPSVGSFSEIHLYPHSHCELITFNDTCHLEKKI